jgi:hypothetical protein
MLRSRFVKSGRATALLAIANEVIEKRIAALPVWVEAPRAGRQPAWQHHLQIWKPRLIGANRPARLLALAAGLPQKAAAVGRGF